jgi:hypothetical protein
MVKSSLIDFLENHPHFGLELVELLARSPIFRNGTLDPEEISLGRLLSGRIEVTDQGPTIVLRDSHLNTYRFAVKGENEEQRQRRKEVERLVLSREANRRQWAFLTPSERSDLTNATVLIHLRDTLGLSGLELLRAFRCLDYHAIDRKVYVPEAGENQKGSLMVDLDLMTSPEFDQLLGTVREALDLVSIGGNYYPPHITSLTLKLVDDDLSKVLRQMSALTDLRHLRIDSDLNHLYLDATSLHQLTSLTINTYNPILGSRLSFAGLTGLERLSLKSYYNTGPHFPCEGVDRLDQLTSLKWSSRLYPLGGSLGSLTGLVELDLSDSGLFSVPVEMTGLSRLGSLDLSDNFLRNLPGWIDNFSGLTRLSCRNNRGLTALPEELGNLISLKLIDLSGCSALDKGLDQAFTSTSELFPSPPVPLDWSIPEKCLMGPLSDSQLPRLSKVPKGTREEHCQALSKLIQGSVGNVCELCGDLPPERQALRIDCGCIFHRDCLEEFLDASESYCPVHPVRKFDWDQTLIDSYWPD